MTAYLVTGGAGFIGSHIVDALIQRGDRARVLDNFSTGKRTNLQHLSDVEIIEGDIRDAGAVRRAMSDIDFVIHQAALVSVPQSITDPVTTHAVNVNGTLNVLSAAREFRIKRVVLASSCAVYGDNNDLPLRETSVTNPLSPYAASKLIGEVYCQTFYRSYGLPTVCLRYFNVYGPRQDPNGDYAAVIPKFAQRLAQGQPPIIYGDGMQTRDFVYVADIVRANLLVCERERAAGEVFNVASGRGVSLLDLTAAFDNLCHTRCAPQFEAARAGDIKHSRGDNTKGAALLGFQPLVSLADGLQQTLNDSVPAT
jgi:nucleoside-diphosphate-sugar epimerase